MELVPFQQKRKLEFPEGTSIEDAVRHDLSRYLGRYYPALRKEIETKESYTTPSLTTDIEKKTLYTCTVSYIPRLVELARVFAPVASPELINDTSLPWTLSRLDAPVVTLSFLKEKLQCKNAIDLLPKPYRTILKRVYSDENIMGALAINIGSKKRAKKYLRILQKRLGIYHEKKQPFLQRFKDIKN